MIRLRSLNWVWGEEVSLLKLLFLKRTTKGFVDIFFFSVTFNYSAKTWYVVLTKEFVGKVGFKLLGEEGLAVRVVLSLWNKFKELIQRSDNFKAISNLLPSRVALWKLSNMERNWSMIKKSNLSSYVSWTFKALTMTLKSSSERI